MFRIAYSMRSMNLGWIIRGTAWTGCDGPAGGPSLGPPRRPAPAPRPAPRRPCAAHTPSVPWVGPGDPAASVPGTHVAAAPPRSDRIGGAATPRHADRTDRPGRPGPHA